MAERIKLKITAPKTREEMEQLVGDICALKIRERELKAKMDAELKRVRDGFEKQLGGLTEDIAAKMPRALAWAEANAEDFGKLRSIEMLHGAIGWRTNTPSLKTRSGWTWDRVLEKLRSLGNFGAAFIRVKEEVNKQLLLAEREGLGEHGLKDLGLQVVQQDEFFVEPKMTETINREVA
jgi:phage host-nuclease inhibitor protein Gam